MFAYSHYGNNQRLLEPQPNPNPDLIYYDQPFTNIENFASITEWNLYHQINDLYAQNTLGVFRNIPLLTELNYAFLLVKFLGECLRAGDPVTESVANTNVAQLLQQDNRLYLTQDVCKQCVSLFQELLQSNPNKELGFKLIRYAQQMISLTIGSNRLWKTNYGRMLPEIEIIIGVDATPRCVGGYCVNTREKTLEFYSIKMSDIPWKIKRKMDADEFEMKNFMLALCIWNKKIGKFKKFAIYTDNQSVTIAGHKYGGMADKLVQHFVECEKAKLKSNPMFLRRKSDLCAFATFIQPADDLSRERINEAVEFLGRVHGIDMGNVRGTHEMNKTGWFNRNRRTGFYSKALDTVRIFTFYFSLRNYLFS